MPRAEWSRLLAGAVVLGAFAWVSTPPGGALAQGSPDAVLRRADAAAEAGDRRTAERLYRRAASVWPSDPRGPVALVAFLPEDPAVAADPPRRVVARARRLVVQLGSVNADEGSQLDVARALAWARAVAGRPSLAVGGLMRSLSMQDPLTAALLRRLAAVAVWRGDLETAERALDGAHRALPQDADVLRDRAAVHLALGRPERALADLERALLRRPDDPATRRDLAGALLAAGQVDAALAAFDALTEAGDAGPGVHAELALAALEAGRLPEALAAARRAAAADGPGAGAGHAVLGAVFAASGRLDEARAAFEEAVRRDPEERRASRGLATLRSEADSRAPAGDATLGAP